MKTLCLTTGLPFMEAAPGAEPVIDELEVRVLRGLAAGAAWPEEEAERVEVMFAAQPPPNRQGSSGRSPCGGARGPGRVRRFRSKAAPPGLF